MFSLCKFTGYLWNSFEYIGEDATETIEEQDALIGDYTCVRKTF